MPLHALMCHPDTPCSAIERVEVRLDHGAREGLLLSYRLFGDARRVRTAQATPGEAPRRRNELWRGTCCELFVRDAAGSGYREYNFAPNGDWAAYGFDDYRAGMAPLDTGAPHIALERSAEALTLTATLKDAPFDARRPARVALACVIETDAELSFWALAHPPGRPDFHDPRAFMAVPAPPSIARARGGSTQ